MEDYLFYSIPLLSDGIAQTLLDETGEDIARTYQLVLTKSELAMRKMSHSAKRSPP